MWQCRTLHTPGDVAVSRHHPVVPLPGPTLAPPQVMDPEQLARAHLRPEDQAIKDRDVPERLQEALGADGGAGDVASGKIDLDAAADWIYR